MSFLGDSHNKNRSFLTIHPFDYIKNKALFFIEETKIYRK